MSISFEHAIDVARSPEQVFAVLDDISQTPKWLKSCTGIERLTPGPSGVGSRFHYTFQESGHQGSMEGVLTTFIPNERLTCTYSGDLLDVVVDFRLSPTGMGTWLIHTIDVTPKTFLAKMFSPLIRSRLPQQTVDGMDELRKIVESNSPSEG